MAKQLMIKPEKCLGCRTCELVCSMNHYGVFNPRQGNVSVFSYEEAMVSIPVMCMQCEDACCLNVCPVGAISRDPNGTVLMNHDKCIGCKMCMNACPLGNITFNRLAKEVHKCDLCDGDPYCAKYCPTGAITFEDPDETLDRKMAVADSFKEVFGEEGA